MTILKQASTYFDTTLSPRMFLRCIFGNLSVSAISIRDDWGEMCSGEAHNTNLLVLAPAYQ